MKLFLTISVFFAVLSLNLYASRPTVIIIQKDKTGSGIFKPQDVYTLPIQLRISKAVLSGKTNLDFYVNGKIPPDIPFSIKKLKPDGDYYKFYIDSNLKVTPESDVSGARQRISNPVFTLKVDGTVIGLIKTPISESNTNLQPEPVTQASPDRGYPIYDAIYLGRLDPVAKSKTFQEVFKYYGITSQKQLDANPFFKGRFTDLYLGIQAGPNAINALLNSAGNTDVTNLADGLAKFIVARMKEELSIAFFAKFKAAFEKGQGARLKILFPATYTALQQISKEIYNYPQYLQVLRGAFQKDLALLLPDLKQLIDNTDFLAAYPEVKTILSDAGYFAKQFKNGNHPGAILDNYLQVQAKQTSLNAVGPEIYPSLQTLNLISQSLRSGNRRNYWVSKDTLGMLFTNLQTERLYYGFLYQQLLNCPGGDINFSGTSVKSNLTQLAADLDNKQSIVNPVIKGIFEQLQIVDSYFIKVKEASILAGQQPDYADYYGLVSATVNFIGLIRTSPLLAGAKPINDVDPKLDQYLQAIKEFSDICIDLYYKQYPVAIIDINTLFQSTLILPANQDVNTAGNTLKAAQSPELNIQKDGAAFQNNLSDNIKALRDQQVLLNTFTKYGIFIATVASAQTSDDVRKAIEAVAMPVGSASIKRNAAFNIALNAYIGPYLGAEKIHGFDKNSATSYGLSAPVGVSISFGNTPAKGWSSSAFVSLIDLGAIASYRLGQNTSINGSDTLKASNIPQVKLKNIISPGLFFSVGLPKLPISIQGGYQLASTLRSVTAVNSQNQVLDPNTNGLANQFASKLYSRWSVAIVVDIPLLNLYTNSK